MAKLAVHLLATAALWARIQTSPKNTKWRHKQRSGQHTLTRKKNIYAFPFRPEQGAATAGGGQILQAPEATAQPIARFGPAILSTVIKSRTFYQCCLSESRILVNPDPDPRFEDLIFF